jgi:DNA mismatch repair protein MSH5
MLSKDNPTNSIVDREIEIVQTLLEGVLQVISDIETACDVCAELDCLLSFAESSRAFDYRRPIMVEEDIMDIEGGRCEYGIRSSMT